MALLYSHLQLLDRLHLALVLILNFLLSLQQVEFVLLTDRVGLLVYFGLDRSLNRLQLYDDLPVELLDVLQSHFQFFHVLVLFCCEVVPLIHEFLERHSYKWLVPIHREVVLVFRDVLLGSGCCCTGIDLLIGLTLCIHLVCLRCTQRC